jgi:hypothetical protein
MKAWKYKVGGIYIFLAMTCILLYNVVPSRSDDITTAMIVVIGFGLADAILNGRDE